MRLVVRPLFADVIFRITVPDLLLLLVAFVVIPVGMGMIAVRRKSRGGTFLTGVLGTAAGAAVFTAIFLLLDSVFSPKPLTQAQAPDVLEVLGGAGAIGFFGLFPGLLVGLIAARLWKPKDPC